MFILVPVREDCLFTFAGRCRPDIRLEGKAFEIKSIRLPDVDVGSDIDGLRPRRVVAGNGALYRCLVEGWTFRCPVAAAQAHDLGVIGGVPFDAHLEFDPPARLGAEDVAVGQDRPVGGIERKSPRPVAG